MAEDEAKGQASQPDDIRPVSQEELKVALAGPAALCNRFFITIGEAGARIAFAEQMPGVTDPVFRAAVNLSFSDAHALADVLAKLLARSVKVIRVEADQAEKPDA